MREFNPFHISQEFRHLVERLRTFDLAQRAGPVPLDPFRGQEYPGKTLRDELSELSLTDPLRTRLLVWADYLLVRRINRHVDALEATRLHHETHPPRPPFTVPTTYAEMRRAALSFSADADGTVAAKACWDALRATSSALSGVRRARLDRVVELEERLGSPLTPALVCTEAGQAAPDQTMAAIARQLLSDTQGAVESLVPRGFTSLVRAGLGVAAAEGWPARLAPDTILALLGGRWVVARWPVPGVPLPSRLAPASYVRAVLEVGQVVARAAAPTSLPFICAQSPDELGGLLLGRVLALPLFTGAFARRRWGLCAERVHTHRRAMSACLLIELRQCAARVLLLEAGRRGARALDEVWGELGPSLCGRDLGPPLGLFAAGTAPSSTFAAWLLALDREARLQEVHDEDWLDNPRARDDLLSGLSRVPTGNVEAVDLRSGLSRLGLLVAH